MIHFDDIKINEIYVKKTYPINIDICVFKYFIVLTKNFILNVSILNCYELQNLCLLNISRAYSLFFDIVSLKEFVSQEKWPWSF